MSSATYQPAVVEADTFSVRRSIRNMASHQEGWTVELDKLVVLLESRP